ncbi:hypothetical protein ACSMXN_07590 [Jatrophihabitans sp. DSM 45814]
MATADWRSEVADGLSPQEVSAGLVTGTIRVSDLPAVAAWWLADDRDTPALRELGGAPTDEPWTLEALWERFIDELRFTRPDREDAARLDVRRILTSWNAGRISTSAVLRELDLMALYRFDGLDVTGGLLDEIEGRWGRDQDDVLADADMRLTDLLRDLGPRPAWPSNT